MPFYQKNFFNQTTYAYGQCVYIVYATYQIAPSKAVVGVDQPMKALSMYIQKLNKGKIV